MESEIPLFERATSLATVRTAWARVKHKNKRGSFDGDTVAVFDRDADAKLADLAADLREGRYLPEPALEIQIPKGPGRTGTRTLRLLSVRDKIAQESVRTVIEPVLDRGFLDCSYGYRIGKGPARALARVEHILHSLRRRWVVTADIDDFFGTVDLDLLVEKLRAVLPEPRLIDLIELWARMGALDRRARFRDVRTGVAQGAVLSPLLANLYLHSFDGAMRDRGIELVRYADDFVLLCKDRVEACTSLDAARKYLEEVLRLRLNDEARPVRSIDDEGFVFLGVAFRRDERGVAESKLDHMRAQAAAIARDRGTVEALRELEAAATHWQAHYGAVVGLRASRAIGEVVETGARAIASRAFAGGIWKSVADGVRALDRLALVPISGGISRRRLEALVAGARTPPDPDGSDPASGRKSGSIARQGGLTRRPGESLDAATRRVRRYTQRRVARANELIVLDAGSFIGRSGASVIVKRDRRVRDEVPLARLRAITIGSRHVSMSADVAASCADAGVPVLFLDAPGRLVATIGSPEAGRGTIGLLQMEARVRGRKSLELALGFVRGKLRNQAALLKYLGKYHARMEAGFGDTCRRAVEALDARVEELAALDLDGAADDVRGKLFGIEGRGAQAYWQAFGTLLPADKRFPGRQHAGARDVVNSALNYGYAILRSRVHLALIKTGLMAHVSFLHACRNGGEATLAFDLMEEFRAPVVDRTVLSLIGLRRALRVDPEGHLDTETVSILVDGVLGRLATLTRAGTEHHTLEELVARQAERVVAHLRDESPYRPYLARW